MFNVCTLFT